MTEPLISVVVPVYNVEKYLRECVDSIIVQTYKNLEIILVDDGSPDNCGKICDEYTIVDKRIKVIHKENGGLSDARNVGFEASLGEYIVFIDSDDYVSSCFIETLYLGISKYNCKVAALHYGTDFWDEENYRPTLEVNTQKCNMELLNSDEFLKRMFYMKVATGAPFKMCHRDIFKDIRFPKGYLYEDLATTYKYFLLCDKVVQINAELYAYRKRRDSIIREKFTDKKMIIVNIANDLTAEITKKHSSLRAAAHSRVFSAVFSVFLQVPYENKDYLKKLWVEIKKYRKEVILNVDKMNRKKNIYAAIISLLGMRISYFIGRKFGQKETIKRI